MDVVENCVVDLFASIGTVDGRNPANHQGCKKPVVNNGIDYV